MSKLFVKNTNEDTVLPCSSKVSVYILAVCYYILMERRTVLVLTSFLALLLAGGTVVSAQDLGGDAPRGNWDTTESTGEIILDGESYYTVFQGERDIDGWRNVDGEDVSGEILTRSTGGDVLELSSSVDREQETGRYESDDGEITARVLSPRVSRFNLYNRNGVRLSADSGVRSNSPLLVEAEWNFVEAEDLELAVTDSEGVEITREVLTTNPTGAQADLLPSGFSESFLNRVVQGSGSTGYSSAYWLIDPDELPSGRNELRVRGVEDLDFDRATESMTVSVGSRDTPSLSFDTTTVSQGERVRYTVRGGESGNYYAVAVRTRDTRGTSNPNDVFRYVGDTQEVGTTDGYAYAVVRISNRGTAIGSIDSTHLERGSVSVRLFGAGSSVGDARDSIGGREADTRSVEVERSELRHNLASGTYVTGQSIDVSGTASPGVDRIAMYVRHRGDWEILPLNGRDTTTVRSDGTWIARNVVLSEEDYGGRLFRLPGTYSVAVVDAAELSSPPPRTISTSEFGRLTSSRTTTRVNEPTFVANIRSYGGEVARGDRVGFTAISRGSRDVVVGFVGSRNVRAEVVRTTRGDTIDTNIDIGEMQRGEVTAFAISPGRDGNFGNGRATDAEGNAVSVTTPSEFRDFVRSFDRDGRTRSQKIDRIRADSVERAGSDDLIRTTTFRITDARTTVRDIVPGEQPGLTGIVPIEQGESVLVRGTTNRNPEDTDITVEVTEGPDAPEFNVVRIRDWSGTRWSATFTTSGVSTGTYTVEADDGTSTDRRSFTVVERREADPDDTETLRQRLEEVRTELEAVRSDNDEMRESVAELREERDRLRERLNETETDQPDGEADGETDDEQQPEDDEQEQQDTPGFTAVVAVVAVIVAAVLIAKRRR